MACLGKLTHATFCKPPLYMYINTFRTSWDGVEGTIENKADWNRGYCTHSQLLFGTWHRPYLILFEVSTPGWGSIRVAANNTQQKLQQVAKTIASQFPAATKAKYQAAADKLRLPFWDWAKALSADEPMMPPIVSTPNVQVTFPNGTVKQIGNPLYQYNFHPLDNTQINGTVSILLPLIASTSNCSRDAHQVEVKAVARRSATNINLLFVADPMRAAGISPESTPDSGPIFSLTELLCSRSCRSTRLSHKLLRTQIADRLLELATSKHYTTTSMLISPPDI